MAKSFVINNIKLCNFRNYEKFEIDKFQNVNVFVGPNAVGKSNLLEAIQLMTQNLSFRHPLTKDYINHNNSAEFASVQTCFLQDFGDGASNKNDLSLLIEADKKTYKLNDKKRSIAQCKGKFPSVVFTPDDLQLVKKSNSLRRQMLDNLGGQISSEYYTVTKDFNKILKQKNKLLKDNADKELLKSINEVFIMTSAQLSYFRFGLAKRLLPIIRDLYSEISSDNEDLSIEYFASWDDNTPLVNLSRDDARDQMTKIINDKKDAEVLTCRSIFGAQKDKITFKLNNNDASNFASQGQQRSIVLTLKLAELILLEKMLNIKPILLLDDVMSELDKTRRTKLLDYISKKTQVFISTTNLDYFNDGFLENAKVVNLGK